MTEPATERPSFWQQWRWLLISVAAIGVLGAARYVAQQLGWLAAGQLSGSAVADSVEDYYQREFQTTLTVECPEEVPLQKDKITDCTATNHRGQSANVTVTVVDLDGHYNFQISDPSLFYPSAQ